MTRSLRHELSEWNSFIAPAGTWSPRPHVAVLLPNLSESNDLLLRLAHAHVTVVEPGHSLAHLQPVDVALIHEERLGLDVSPLLCAPELGFPELVFVVDHAGSAQHLALKSRGFRHVVSEGLLLEWFPGVVSELASLAQARRVVLRACADQPTQPEAATSRTQGGRGVQLHVAETAFREIFLRSLLAEHGSRRRAAEEAGVPYRSFCEMLRKLGI
jgi:hypothetical protein